MPQVSYIQIYRAIYPLQAPLQKPGGVTVTTSITGGDVPNKPTYAAGTIQMVEAEATAEVEVDGTQVTAHAEASVAVEPASQ
jgi:hypothetical protein